MENKRLTLQEKMVRIRARIPSLVKQAYSEEVSYDFVKIDDIFRYLTPAMNEYGVNFDIVSETATKKDERGNPMFVEFIPLYQMWIYEADLTFQWTNGENGEDRLQVTAHAIGFHQMPEKAKGSGWTYCLKYYLLNKFCINQGGDDPDMRNVVPGADMGQEEMDGALDGAWSYGEENGYPQGNDMEPAAFRELEEEFQETGEPVENEAVFGQEIGNVEGEAINGLQEADGGFQNGGEREEEQSGEMTEEYLSEEPEGYSVNQSLISPDQGTMVTLPESAGEPLNLAETSSVGAKANANGDRNSQKGSRSVQGNAANRGNMGNRAGTGNISHATNTVSTANHGDMPNGAETRNGANAGNTVNTANTANVPNGAGAGMSHAPNRFSAGNMTNTAARPNTAKPNAARPNTANQANPINPVQPPVNTAGSQGGMTVEEASNVICNCGLYRGKTLGEIARSGEDGIQNLKWFVNSYRGRNEELRIGARVLLEAAMAEVWFPCI